MRHGIALDKSRVEEVEIYTFKAPNSEVATAVSIDVAPAAVLAGSVMEMSGLVRRFASKL